LLRFSSFYLLHTLHSNKKEQERGKKGGQYRCISIEMMKVEQTPKHVSVSMRSYRRSGDVFMLSKGSKAFARAEAVFSEQRFM
jgi:hypothetical protein